MFPFELVVQSNEPKPIVTTVSFYFSDIYFCCLSLPIGRKIVFPVSCNVFTTTMFIFVWTYYYGWTGFSSSFRRARKARYTNNCRDKFHFSIWNLNSFWSRAR